MAKPKFTNKELYLLRRAIEMHQINAYIGALTIDELSKRLKTSKQKIRRWIEDGKIPPPMLQPPAIIRWPVEQIERWEHVEVWLGRQTLDRQY